MSMASMATSEPMGADLTHARALALMAPKQVAPKKVAPKQVTLKSVTPKSVAMTAGCSSPWGGNNGGC